MIGRIQPWTDPLGEISAQDCSISNNKGKDRWMTGVTDKSFQTPELILLQAYTSYILYNEGARREKKQNANHNNTT